MRFSIISVLLSAAAFVTAAPTPVDSAATSASTYTAASSLVPTELASLFDSGKSMLVTSSGGLLGTSLLSSTDVLFGTFNDDGTSDVAAKYTVPLDLLPPQLVYSLSQDVSLLVSEGPTDLLQIVVGALTFTPSVSKRDVEVKRQVPISGPIGNFIAQLIGALPIEALPSL